MGGAGQDLAPTTGAAGWHAALQRAWWSKQTSPLALLLLPLSALYGAAWRLREALYAAGLFRAERLRVPVVVVGNLIVGGAGKTPTVIALVEALRRDGWHPGVLSRGYGSQATSPVAVEAASEPAKVGDEPLLIRRRTGAPVWVGRDRMAVGRALLAAEPGVDIVVCDDGLQHRRLHRDASLIVFDERGVGNGHLLPAGPLRQPFARTPPAASVVLYNAAAPTTPWPGAVVSRRLGGVSSLQDWRAGVSPDAGSLAAWRGRRVHAAAGIAVPGRFFAALEAAGLHVQPHPLPDHASIDRPAWPIDGTPVLVTEKDAVKLTDAVAHGAALHVVTLDSTLPDAVLAALRGHLPTRDRP